jgi:hypothetical protein
MRKIYHSIQEGISQLMIDDVLRKTLANNAKIHATTFNGDDSVRQLVMVVNKYISPQKR